MKSVKIVPWPPIRHYFGENGPVTLRPLRTALIACCAVAVSGCATYTMNLEVPKTSDESTKIFDTDGNLIATLHAEQNREPVRLDQVSPAFLVSIVATEDLRFFSHNGVDLKAITAAFVENVEEGRVSRGGSTITQQYVRNVLLTQEKTAKRKLREAVLAIQVERKFDKPAILQRYVNTVYFGNGAYGIQAAAQLYFNKPASDLTLAEGALLAGLIKAPEDYEPYGNAEAAIKRRNLVINEVQENQEFLAPDFADAIAAPHGSTGGNVGSAFSRSYLFSERDIKDARAATVGTVPQATNHRYPNGHFIEQVKRVILEDERFGATREERERLLFQGGLRIFTTLDSQMQFNAIDAISKVLVEPGIDPSGALVAIDPHSGAVRAYVGGRDFFGGTPEAKFDLAGQGLRQAGSSFKPFVLAAALQEGIPLWRTYEAPGQITIPMPGGQDPWEVDNYDGGGAGQMNLVEATIRSVNTVYAQLIMDVGPQKVVDLAESMGVESDLLPYPSAALGTNGVTVLDMASGYGTFAADGLHSDPVFVTKVTSRDGTLLYSTPAENRERILDKNLARQVNGVLQQVVTNGTGTRAKIGRPTAGKTGTAQAWRDAWFVGYTPDLVAAVWVGFADAQRSMLPPDTRIKVTGGSWPAEIWGLFAGAALAEVTAAPFVEPEAESLQPVPGPDSPAITIPSVVGMLEEDARRVLSQQQWFSVHVVAQASREIPAGVVIAQNPMPSSEALIGTEVILTISSGPPVTVLVPSLLGLFADEAAALLREAGLVMVLQVEAEPPPASSARYGRVWKQSPAAGTEVAQGTDVKIWVNPDG